MRGIERLIAGALLVMAVTGTAVLARTSAPDGGHAQAMRLQSPPRSQAVAGLPVVVAVPEPSARRIVLPPPRAPITPFHVSVALTRRAETTPAPSNPPPAPAPTPAPQPPAAPTPAPAPAPTPTTTRVTAAAQPPAVTTTAKTFGHSHPRGHAWGHVKHALTTLSAGTTQADDNAQAQEPAPPVAAAPTLTAPPAPQDQPSSDDDQGNGNGNGHAYGHSKHGNGN